MDAVKEDGMEMLTKYLGESNQMVLLYEEKLKTTRNALNIYKERVVKIEELIKKFNP